MNVGARLGGLRPDPAWVLAVAAGLAPPLGLVAALAEAPVLITAAVLVLPTTWNQRPDRALGTVLLALLAAFVAWAGVSSLWALVPADALKETAANAGEIVAGAVVLRAAQRLEPARIRLVGVGLAVGMAVATTYLAAEIFRHVPLSIWLHSHNGVGPDARVAEMSLYRGMTVMTIVMWPMVTLLHRQGRGWVGLAIAAVMVATVFQSNSLAARSAVPLGLASLALVWAWPRWGLRGLALALALAVLAGPVLIHDVAPSPRESWIEWRWLKSSSHHRLSIWNFTAARIAEKPLWGWGMDAARSIPGGQDFVIYFRDDPAQHRVEKSGEETNMPLHPHNAILQWWLELGVPGGLLGAGIVLAVMAAIGRATKDRLMRGIGAATVVSALMVSAVAYGAWQKWWLSALWLAAALCVAAMRAGSGKSDSDTPVSNNPDSNDASNSVVHAGLPPRTPIGGDASKPPLFL